MSFEEKLNLFIKTKCFWKYCEVMSYDDFVKAKFTLNEILRLLVYSVDRAEDVMPNLFPESFSTVLLFSLKTLEGFHVFKFSSQKDLWYDLYYHVDEFRITFSSHHLQQDFLFSIVALKSRIDFNLCHIFKGSLPPYPHLLWTCWMYLPNSSFPKQDVAWGWFLKGVQLVWILSFLSPKFVALLRLKIPVCLTIKLKGDWEEINSCL